MQTLGLIIKKDRHMLLTRPHQRELSPFMRSYI